MRSRSRRLLLSGLVALVALGVASPAWAERTQSDLVLVRADDVITEDLYAAGNSIRVEGRIEGDLVAAALDEVVVSGEVTGDVIAIAGRVTISGTVGGALRVAAGTIEVSGTVGDDVVAASWSSTLGEGSVAGRDVFLWGFRALAAGEVGRNLEGQVSRLRLDGAVKGAVNFTAARLSAGDGASVEGNLTYRSPREADLGNARVDGIVVRQTSLPPNVRVRALIVLTVSLAWLLLTAFGLVLAWGWPRRLEAAVAAARRGWITWLAGLAAVLSPLLAVAVLAAVLAVSSPEAGVPLAAVFLPLILLLVALAAGLAVVGLIPAAGLAGRWLLPRRSIAAASLAGMFLIGIALLLPVLRWLVLAVALPLGAGAWLRRAR
jgi:cytoskeletal protein CcmA (bactofilin family)